MAGLAVRSRGITPGRGEQEVLGELPASVVSGAGLYNITAFNGVSDGTAINAALTTLGGPGAVVLPAGTAVIDSSIILGSGQFLIALAGPGRTILQRKASFTGHIISSAGYGTAGAASGFGAANLTIDGNRGANATYNASAGGIVVDGFSPRFQNIEIHDCLGDGFWSQQTPADVGGANQWGDTRDVRAWHNNGTGYKVAGPHDSKHEGVVSWSNGLHGIHTLGTTGAHVFSNSHAFGSNDYAWYLEASVLCINCEGEGATTGNVFLGCDNNQWIGGRVFKDGAGNGAVGFIFGDGTHTAFNTRIVGVSMENQTGGTFVFNATGGNSIIDGYVLLSAGTAVTNGTGAPASTIRWNVIVNGGGTLGAGFGSYGSVVWNQTIRNALQVQGNVGFFNTSPIAQPTPGGVNATGFTAGTGTAVVSGSTFTGATGSTAYTIGDVVSVLKQFGLFKP